MSTTELNTSPYSGNLAERLAWSQVGALTAFTEWLAKSVMGKEPNIPFRFSAIASWVKDHINTIKPDIIAVPGTEVQIPTSHSPVAQADSFKIPA